VPRAAILSGEREQEAVLLHAQEYRVVDDPAVRQAQKDVLALLHGALVQIADDE
jgi:hypothetical protein